MSRSKFAKWDPNLPETRTVKVAGLTVEERAGRRAAKAARPMGKRYSAILAKHYARKPAANEAQQGEGVQS